MRRALLWKDIRLLKDTLAAAIALLVFSYVVAAVLVYTGGDGGFSWAKVVAGGASLVRFTSILISALVGGHICGSEREDGSIDFLRQLPAAGREALRSKIVVSAAALGTIWTISLMLLVLGLAGIGYGVETNLRVLQAMLGFFASGVAVYGAAFFASCCVSSAVGASFAGLLVLVPFVALQSIANWACAIEDRDFFHWSTIVCMLALGSGCVIAFSWLNTGNARGLSADSGFRIGFAQQAARRAIDELPDWSEKKKPRALSAVAWKDFLLIRTSLGLGVIVLAIPYVIGVVGTRLIDVVPAYFRGASLICASMGCLVVTFWVGQIQSAEHTAKTVEFSSQLPIPRLSRTLGKLLVTICPAGVLVTLNTVCLVMSNNMVPDAARFGPHFTWNDWNGNGFLVMGFALANGTILAYSASWLLGVHYRRPTPSIVGGLIAVPVCVMAWAAASAWVSALENAISPLIFVVLVSTTAGLLATVDIVAGFVLADRAQSG